jgi:hypothetical protein
MDYLSIEPDRSNTKDVLVITDFFTKYALAIPTPNQKARRDRAENLYVMILVTTHSRPISATQFPEGNDTY